MPSDAVRAYIGSHAEEVRARPGSEPSGDKFRHRSR